MESIAGIDIKELVNKYGSPIYVYDAEKIRGNYKRLHNAFAKHYSKTKIHYSVKANSNLNILKIFKELGAGVDCSSPIELLLAEKSGFTHQNMLYTGNYESMEDLSYLKNKDIRINLDDIESFERMIKIFKPKGISFRINPGIGKGGFEGITTAGTDAKFGIPYEMAYDAYKIAMDQGIKRFGIHMMTGSNNLEPYYFSEIVDKLLTIAGRTFNPLGIQPEYIDIGGGLGIPYEDGEPELNVDMAARLISEVFAEKSEKFGFDEPELLLEPGRFLVADAGYLVSSVTGVKKSYKTFVGIDAGMNTLIRPALYGARHRTFVYGKKRRDSLVNLCGRICENSDIFANNIPFPEVSEGDLVTFSEAGAYGYVMASNYNNRLRPAEILIDNGADELIRRAETIDDIFRLYEF